MDTFKLSRGGVHNGKDTSTVCAGVPASDGRAGPLGPFGGELAREFGCCAQTIRNWVRQSDRDEGRRDDGLTSSELEELRRLRRENRRLREEREILKNARSGLLGRPVRCRGGLRAREGEPGRACGVADVPPKFRSLRELALCWASPPAGTTRGEAVGGVLVRSATRSYAAPLGPSTRSLEAPTGCLGCMRS